MILSDKEIRERVLNFSNYNMQQPMISPFVEEQLQGASYDVTIEDEVIFSKQSYEIVDIKDQEGIEKTYKHVKVGDDGFLLYPNSYVLTTLKEVFYIPRDLTAHLRPKTRLIRLGLFMSGQHINPESVCKLNIGIYNMTPNPIRLYKNISIGQIVFEQLNEIPSDDKLYISKKDAHYSSDIEFVGANFEDEFAKLVNDTVNNMLGLD